MLIVPLKSPPPWNVPATGTVNTARALVVWADADIPTPRNTNTANTRPAYVLIAFAPRELAVGHSAASACAVQVNGHCNGCGGIVRRTTRATRTNPVAFETLRIDIRAVRVRTMRDRSRIRWRHVC